VALLCDVFPDVDVWIKKAPCIAVMVHLNPHVWSGSNILITVWRDLCTGPGRQTLIVADLLLTSDKVLG